MQKFFGRTSLNEWALTFPTIAVRLREDTSACRRASHAGLGVHRNAHAAQKNKNKTRLLPIVTIYPPPGNGRWHSEGEGGKLGDSSHLMRNTGTREDPEEAGVNVWKDVFQWAWHIRALWLERSDLLASDYARPLLQLGWMLARQMGFEADTFWAVALIGSAAASQTS